MIAEVRPQRDQASAYSQISCSSKKEGSPEDDRRDKPYLKCEIAIVNPSLAIVIFSPDSTLARAFPFEHGARRPFRPSSRRSGDGVPEEGTGGVRRNGLCLLYTSPSPRDGLLSRM